MRSSTTRLGGLLRPPFVAVLMTLLAAAALAFPAWGAAAPQSAGPKAAGAFSPSARIEDDDPRVAFAGGWRLVSTSSASGGTRMVATKPGATAKIRFKGTGAGLVSRVSRTGGRVAISVDGGAWTSVDLTRTSTVERMRVWRVSGLRNAAHTVVVRAVETSPTTSWRASIVDRFEIEGSPLAAPASGRHSRIEESDRRIRFLGTWTNRARVSSASKGRASIALKGGAKAEVAFNGTGISWLAPNQAVGAKAQVVVDGRSLGYVALNRVGAKGARRVMFAISGLTYGRHSLEIRTISTAKSSARVVVDTFDIVGTPGDARPRSSLGYRWDNYIVIDKSEFRLYLVKNGLLERTYPIAHGKLGWATPSRVWRVGMKYPHTGGVYGPRKMRLFKSTGGSHYVFSRYGIHGTNQPWVIGTRASHGCIRLYNDDIVDLYPRVPMGTMVVTRD